VSHPTLRRWIDEQAQLFSIAVYGREHTEAIQLLLAPRTVEAVPAWPELVASGPLRALWRSFTSLVNRYQFIVVLCATDEEAMTGHTAYRILGETLLSDRIVLIGPSVARMWPGGCGGFTVARVRELMILVATGGMGLFTTAVALIALSLQDALIRLRVLR